jgi:hypothetical protein
MAYLRRLGYLAARVEVYLPAVQRHRDLFGIGDVLGVHPRDRSVLLVQCTTAGHVADRLRRVKARPELPQLLRAGVTVEVWGWSLVGGEWQVRRVAIKAEGLEPVVLRAPPRRRREARQGLLFAE